MYNITCMFTLLSVIHVKRRAIIDCLTIITRDDRFSGGK